MRKVNIMVEVSDEIYDSVVEPYKKTKKFTRLIQNLLEGYYKDDYIACYIEGTLESAIEESRKSFENVMQAMKDNLASLSMMEGEASAYMERGMQEFSSDRRTSSMYNETTHSAPVKHNIPMMIEEKAEEKVVEVAKTPEQVSPDWEERVKNIEDQNKKLTETLSNVEDLIQKVLSGNINIKDIQSSLAPKAKEEVAATTQEVVTPVVEDVVEDKVEVKEAREELNLLPLESTEKKVVVEEEDEVFLFNDGFVEDEEEEDEDDGFLDDLLQGNMYQG